MPSDASDAIINVMVTNRPKVMVLGSADRLSVHAKRDELRSVIEKHAEIVNWDLGFQADLATVEADYAIVLGGDGSILRAARQMGHRQVPVIGVNLGKLGFLADLSPDEFVAAFPRLCREPPRVVEHLMFEYDFDRAEANNRGEDEIAPGRQLGLNEVAILAGAPFAMLEVHLRVDAELVTTYSCDGLIVATPVGSTAHSLSAGGPILRKDLQAFVISPISPHALTNRPVIDSADRVYELEVPRPHEGTAAVVDGRVIGVWREGDRLRIQRAPCSFKLVEAAGHGYYRTLRQKLGWSGSFRTGDSFRASGNAAGE